MTSNRFHIKKKNIRSDSVTLEGDEHHHLSHVARLRVNDKVWLFDESGTTYSARVEKISKNSSILKVIKQQPKENPRNRLALAQSLLKSKKMEFLLQKGTELGMTEFIPVQSTRSVVKTDTWAGSKGARWEKIAIETLKQSGRSILPVVHPPAPLNRLIQDRKDQVKLFLSESTGNKLADVLSFRDAREETAVSVIILCGPEGGWTEDEELYILESGFTRISLGRYTLRAETAAICCLAFIQQLWNL